MAISPHNSAVDSPTGNVRDRLLDSAEQLFAEHGFDGTSIRDLASAARCNIASVNYYFGGKEKLYSEIWRRHLHVMTETRIASIDRVLSESEGRPVMEDLLRSFAYAFIGSLVDESGSPRLAKLMAREMLDPHLPPNVFVEDVIKPTLEAMHRGLARACPGLPESNVPLVTFSLVGQLLHTIRIRTMLSSMEEESIPVFELAEVIDHIVAFSAAGIRAYARGEAE